MLRGRVPFRISRRASGDHVVAWAKPSRPLLETSMYDWALSDDDLRYTTLDALFEYGRGFDHDKFRGCVFHMSRCGSTAIANAFRAVRHLLVVSEARTLTSILLPPRIGGLDVPPAEKSLLAAGFMAAVLKECAATGIVLKLPSILCTEISSTLALLPPARWCFSSRRPNEVIRSLERSPSGWLGTEQRRGKAMAMLEFTSTPEFTEAERARELFAHVLERCLTSACSAMDARAIYLDYADFEATSVANVTRFVLGEELDDATRGRQERSLDVYSKSLDGRAFVPDSPLADEPTGMAALDQAYERYLKSRNASGAFNAAAGTINLLAGSL